SETSPGSKRWIKPLSFSRCRIFSASVVTGEVDGAPFDVSKGGFFRSFERKGAGKYRLHAHVGAGEVSLN
ncbi:MAG: hypothetical protein L0191_08090, partial [Acidobacteria bacterium]|nr:hypothetical protein [Acidobacteriota bacterium]